MKTDPTVFKEGSHSHKRIAEALFENEFEFTSVSLNDDQSVNRNPDTVQCIKMVTLRVAIYKNDHNNKSGTRVKNIKL
jgi:hypothetical protein